MRLAAYVIVRDEELSLSVTLESVKPFVDEIVVCDTGSTDKTVEVARGYTDHVLIHPRSEEWRADRGAFDFSAARNHALMYLDNLDVDWILSIDADETLDPESGQKVTERLPATPELVDCILVTMVMCHDNDEEYQHFLAERLIRNKRGARFEREMHNILDVPVDRRMDWPEIRLLHNRKYRAAESRYDRSHQRLELAERYFPRRIEADLTDARSTFYLAGTYFDCGRLQEACEWFERYMPVSEWVHERYQAAMLLSQCYINQGDLEKARTTMTSHLTDNWRRAEGLILLGDIAVAQQDWRQAEWWYKCATLKEQPVDPLFVEVPAHTWEPHYKLYRVYQALQANQEAANHGMTAVSLGTPKSAEVIWWVKNHLGYGSQKITCLVDRGQMSFIQPVIDDWLRQGKEVSVCTEAADVPKDSEIVWCEWAGVECVKYTHEERNNATRTIVRVHGYEIHSGFVPQVNWAHVDDVIFVAHYLRDMAVQECPAIQELCNLYVVPGGVETEKFNIGNPRGTGRFLRISDPCLDEDLYVDLVSPDGTRQWSRTREYHWILDRVREASAERGSACSVVDVGAGYTKLAEAIQQLGIANVTRQDIDDDAMAAATARAPGIPTVRDLPEQSYDIVVSVSVWEHVEDRQEFINGLYRTLKPGGRLLLTFDFPRVTVEEGLELVRNAGFTIGTYESERPDDALAAAYVLNTQYGQLTTDFALAIYAIDVTKPQAKDGTKLAMACYGNTKKEFPLALQVMAALPSQYSLHIATEWQDDRLHMYFRHMREEMGLEGRVTLYPWQENLNEFYADKDFYLSTSMEEAFQYSLAEGMAAGLKPVIHAWKSARDFYQPEWIWRTIEEATNLICREANVSQRMREYAIEHLDIKQNLRRIDRIIHRPKVAVTGAPKFEHAAENKMVHAFAGLGCRVDAPDDQQDIVLIMGRTPTLEPWMANTKKVLWISDMLFDEAGNLAPEEEDFRAARAELLDKVDIVGVLSPSWVPILEAEGATNVEWMPIMGAAAPFRYLPKTEKEYEVGFYGVVTPRRERIIEELGKEFDVHVLENNFDHEQVNLFINRCKVVVNLHAYGDSRPEWRLAECGAAGAIVVSEPIVDCGWILPNVYEVPTSALVERIRSLLQNPEPGDSKAFCEWYWRHFRLDQSLERLLERFDL